MNEIRALTGARGIAAWMVVLYHIRESIHGLHPGAQAVLARGYLAVDFFFLLSGFVIWLTWHQRLRDGGFAAIPPFLRKRIARIWPLHAVMLAAAIGLALLLRATGRTDPAFPFAQLPLHLLLLQNWGFTQALHWNDPAWSISCELAAYLAFPLLALGIDWRTLPTAVLIGVALALLGTLHGVMGPLGSLDAAIPRVGLVRCLIEFATGTILAALFLCGPRPAAAWIVAALAAAAWAAGLPETLCVPTALSALLLGLALTARAPRHPLEGRIVHYLGEISYATYLCHFLLWKVFRLAFVRADVAVSPTLIALYGLAVLAASIALYHGVERPAQRWINHRPARRPARG